MSEWHGSIWVLEFRLYYALGLGLGLEEVFVFDSESENRDRPVETVES